MAEEILQRTCINCKQTLSIENFQWRIKAKGIRRTRCRECQNQINRKSYLNTLNQYLDIATSERKDKRLTVREYKEKTPCMDCGNKFEFYVMEFDHRSAADKLLTISKNATWGNMQLMRDELAKCDLVCSNCHKRRTHLRQFADRYKDKIAA